MTPTEPRPRGVVRGARGCLVALASALAAAMLIAFVVYQVRAPLLTQVGGVLYHEDPLAAADAIAVLGGGGLERIAEAADLFMDGYAPVVLLTRTPEDPAVAELQARGLGVSTALEAQMAYLGALGVPRDATTVLQRVVDSTQAEAMLIAEWAESRQLGRIIVVTAGYRTSRVRLVFNRVLRGRPTEVVVRPSALSGFAADSWWHDRPGRRNGLFELEKILYYRIMYLLRQTP